MNKRTECDDICRVTHIGVGDRASSKGGVMVVRGRESVIIFSRTRTVTKNEVETFGVSQELSNLEHHIWKGNRFAG